MPFLSSDNHDNPADIGGWDGLDIGPDGTEGWPRWVRVGNPDEWT